MGIRIMIKIVEEDGRHDRATRGDDEILVTMNDVAVSGDRGNDKITSIMFADGIDTKGLAAGSLGWTGQDTLRASLALDSGSTYASAYLDGQKGDDVLWVDVTGQVAEQHVNVRGGEGNDRVDIASSVSDGTKRGHVEKIFASGGEGNDRISAMLSWAKEAGSAVLRLKGGTGEDQLTATMLTPSSKSTDAHASLDGGSGHDVLTVTGGTGNILDGGTGADVLLGGDGVDRLIGGAGIDTLTGGDGEDVFIFTSTGAGGDRITDFTRGDDQIKVTGIDADASLKGHQHFAFGVEEEEGAVWVEENPKGHGSLVHADTGREVLTFSLLDGLETSASDYTSSDFIL